MAGQFLEVGVCYERDGVPPVQYRQFPLSKTFLKEGSRKTFTDVKAHVEDIISGRLPEGTEPKACVLEMYFACGAGAPRRVGRWKDVVAEEVEPRNGEPGVDLWVVISNDVPLERSGYRVESYSGSKTPPSLQTDDDQGAPQQNPPFTPGAAAPPPGPSPANPIPGHITAEVEILSPRASSNESEVAASLERPVAGLSISAPAASAAQCAPAALAASLPPQPPVTPPQTSPRATAAVPAPHPSLPDTPAASETLPAAADQQVTPSPQRLPSGPSAFGTVPNVPCPISDATRPIRKSQQATNQSLQPPPLKRQVFISHTKSDADAGRRFAASTLRPALLHAGVSVFMDFDSIQAGEDWGWSLIDNAANSAVVVLVLSRSFLTRYWCMLELDLALNAFRGQRVEPGQGPSSSKHRRPVVIPVLYDDIVEDLQPDKRERKRVELRQDVELGWSDPQNARKLVAGFKSDNEKQWGQLVAPERWMKNIEWVVDRLQSMWLASEAGQVDADWQLARRVTASVLAEIQPVEVVDKNLEGFADQLDELEKVVMQPRNGGWGGLWLYGMGGSGKTTMAALLFNKLACQFERRAFVRIPFGATPDVAAQAVPEALNRLQPSLIGPTPPIQLHDFAAVTKNVLYVLDNVQSGTHLDELLPEKWGAGSVVIVTSRCNAFRDGTVRFNQVKHLFEWRRIHKLAEEPSRRVFRQAAEIMYGTRLPETLQSVEDGVLECCDGLPHALRVMGDQLKQDATAVAEDDWKNYLCALKHGVVPGMDKLQSILKDSLVRQAPGFMELDMHMFLDVATILSGENSSWARDMWEALHPDSKRLVGVRLRELERRSLLHEEDKCLVMHRMLMNIGRGLCLHQQGELSEGCHGTRIWVEEGQVAGCSQAAKTGELRATNPSAFKEKVPVNASSMLQAAHMHVFWLDRNGVLRRYGLPQRPPLKWKRASKKEDGRVQVLSAGQWVKEPQNLAVAVAASHDYKVDHSTLAAPTSPSGSSGGPPTSESSNPDPSRPLGPPSSDSATKTAGPSSQPPSSGSVPPAAAASLTASSSSATRAHRASGNTAHKPSLHELVIRLAPQATVWVRDVEELEQLVLSASAPAMQGLNLTACWRLQKLPASFEQLAGLQALNMCGCEQLAALPHAFGRLAALQSINLRHCKGLTALPESIGQLKMLQALDLSHCEQLASLPESFGHLAALQAADLSNCYALATLPESFGSLACLETLYLNHCTQLAALPDSFGLLRALRALHLVGCTSLAALPASFGQLTALKQLDLSDCRRLGTLPESFGSLRALQNLALVGCVKLSTLPQSFGCQLTQLGLLDLRGCQHLVTLPETCTQLVSLRTLSLSGCQLLTELPAGLGSLAMLEGLDLSWCSRLASLPSSVGGLAALRALDLTGCIALEQLPDSFGELQRLQDVSLRWCQRLESLPTSFGKLAKLHRLDMWDCQSLKALPTDTFRSLTALQTWEVTGCTLLSELPLSPQAFSSLQELHLAGCSHVAHLPESVGGLATLRVLNLAGGSALLALPESLGQLLALELLDVSGCEQLVALPESLGQLAALRVLLIRGCKMLAALPASFGSLGALKVLELVGCHSLQVPPELFRSLQLNTLVIRDCPGIQVPAEGGTGLYSTGLSAATNAGLQLVQSFARWQLRPQVFVSCAAHNPDAMQFASSVLKAALEAAGLHVAMDYTSCEGDFQWHEQLVDAAANSAVVVPVLSQSYGQQYWCMLELDAALHSHSLLHTASNGAAAQPLVLPVFFDEPHEVIDAVHNWDDKGAVLQQLRAEGGLDADWDAAGLAAVVDAPRWEGNIAAMAEAAQHIRRTDSYDKERDLQLAQRVAVHAKQAMHATLAQRTGDCTAGPSEKQRLGGVQSPVPAGGVGGPSSATTLPLSLTVESPPQPSTSEVTVKTPSQPSASEATVKTPLQPSASEVTVKTPSQPSASEVTLKTQSQPSASEVTVKTQPQPSASEVIVKTPPQPSASEVTVKTPPQPSASEVTVKTPSQPSASEVTVKTPSQPSASEVTDGNLKGLSVSGEMEKAADVEALPHATGKGASTKQSQLISDIMALIRAVMHDGQTVLYCKKRAQHVCGRVGALVPRLEDLRAVLNSPTAAMDEPLLNTLSGPLVQLAQLVRQLQQLLQKLPTTRVGTLQTAVKRQKVKKSKQELDQLDTELTSCLEKLATAISKAYTPREQSIPDSAGTKGYRQKQPYAPKLVKPLDEISPATAQQAAVASSASPANPKLVPADFSTALSTSISPQQLSVLSSELAKAELDVVEGS